ncbi:MAG: hypothetical protein ACT4OQ_07650 [Chloroflexota bacterium]
MAAETALRRYVICTRSSDEIGAHTQRMVRARADRRLATVLFVDIVDSTRIASDVGDRRWRELLGSFRRAVRGQLRRHGGHEQDTAGDGFFATFDRPAGSVRAATAIVDAAQTLGFDVRCGLHTGELERIDGRLGGIAAHIGARVMALAGPADVLVTGTVHDLVVGGGISSEPADEAQLKGVPGRWSLYRITEVDGSPLQAPLARDEASLRRGAQPGPRLQTVRRPRLVVLGVATAGAISLAALAAIVLTLPRDEPSLAGLPSPPSGRPPSMVRIDPGTNTVVAEVYDNYLSIWWDGQVLIVDGALWQETAVDMVRRDVETGAVVDAISQPPNTVYSFYAFGSLWFLVPGEGGNEQPRLDRVDPLSGRLIAVIEIEEPLRWVATSRDSVLVLTNEAIIEIDPSSNAIADRDEHGFATVPDAIGSVAGSIWICECEEGRITQWDAESDVPVRTVEFAQRGFILDDQRELSQGSVAIDASVVWLMDGDAGTITPVDTATGTAGQPIGIPQGAAWHVFGLDSVWIASWDQVYRLELETMKGTSIPLPEGVYAGGLAVDEQTGTVWVSNFVPRGDSIPKPMP